MTDKNLNNIATDIISVVGLWGLTNFYYNVASVENKPLYKSSPPFLFYLGLGCVATATTLVVLFKY